MRGAVSRSGSLRRACFVVKYREYTGGNAAARILDPVWVGLGESPPGFQENAWGVEPSWSSGGVMIQRILRWSWVTAGIVVVCCFLGGGSRAEAAPRIHVEQETMDFGEIWEGTKISHTFTLTNQGDEDLLVDKVGAS